MLAQGRVDWGWGGKGGLTLAQAAARSKRPLTGDAASRPWALFKIHPCILKPPSGASSSKPPLSGWWRSCSLSRSLLAARAHRVDPLLKQGGALRVDDVARQGR